MIVRAIDSDGDWLFGKGRNDYRVNIQAVEQNIRTRCLSFLGNCFFDLGAGIDWFSYLSGSKNINLITLALSTTIINTPGVTGILQLGAALDPATRNLAVQYAVTTTYSTVFAQFQFDLNPVL